MFLCIIYCENHVFSGEGLSILPDDILSKVEDICTVLHLPALCQSRNITIFVLPYQCVEDHAHPYISRPSRIMAVRGGKSPIARWVGDGKDIYSLIGSQGGAAEN